MTKEDKIIIILYFAMAIICGSCAIYCYRTSKNIDRDSMKKLEKLNDSYNNVWLQQRYLEEEVNGLKAQLKRAVRPATVVTNTSELKTK